ncbi:GAF domain-containing protein [Pedobacter sp. SYSU D00535]|uniref:GAF domain-containing protein n=1 Tax=Pedobacter sp. SYSU D00535 TaxID=2810308 RepID=UPI001A9698CF|nr:GAF domain-containing protein [Pedobacter sp. SYSU D00535]
MHRSKFDSEFCGSLPLHQINQIQSYGYLLVLDRQSLSIVQASENIEEVFGKQVKAVVGTEIGTYLAPATVDKLRERVISENVEKVPVAVSLQTGLVGDYVAIVHSKTEYIVIELEKSGERRLFLDAFQDFKFALADINQVSSVKDASDVIVDALKRLAGFDRVLMYQFDEDWNGTVISEVREEDMEPYLGLKFPASDIPKQARALYLRNPYRLIPDREYAPVRIFPVINPLTHTFIDLSDCNLRSVPGVHLEYMHNMGIKASMSIRVIRNEQLWGLISCHHREPMYLNYEMCSVFELLSNFISSKVTSILNKEAFEFKARLQSQRNSLIDRVYSSNSLVKGLMGEDLSVKELLDADGVVITRRGEVISAGEVPSKDQLEALIYWLQNKSYNKIYGDDNLVSAYDPAIDFVELGSGILSIPIDSEKGHYIIAFRKEALTTVNWGGNPEDAINFEEDGKQYHPRNSFKLWQETVKQTSLPWLQEQLEIAESLRSFIFEYSARHINN